MTTATTARDDRAQETTHAVVEISADGVGSLRVDGRLRPIRGTDLDDARARVVSLVAARAAEDDRPVIMTITDPAGSFAVEVDPDGRVTDASKAAGATKEGKEGTVAEPGDDVVAVRPGPSPQSPPRAAAASTSATTAPAAPAAGARSALPPAQPAQDLRSGRSPYAVSPPATGWPSTQTPDTVLQPGAGAEASSPAPAGPPGEVVRPLTRAELRAQARQESLLESITNEAPASSGLRGALNAAVGLKLAPSASERGQREDVAAVAQHWPGPRTIAVVNGKGGSGKTPTTILLAATFARYGGAGVVAWDNNATRGTLGWRTLQGPHEATVEDLLPHVDYLRSPQAQAAQMAAFTHHQRLDRYDVLRSRPEALSGLQPSDSDSVDAVHQVLTKYYRIILVDSGNDEDSEQWRAMVAHADAIVVPTITRPEHAESARLLLAELARADDHSAALAESALVVVSQASRGEPGPAELVERFAGMARAAVGVPYDPAMAGRPLILDSLAPPTSRAWLAAAARLADTLT